MARISLLDCTLRDGGYVVNWAFGSNTIINIYSRLIASGVDIIELGYLREKDAFSIDRTSIPSVADISRIYDTDIGDVKRPMMVAMIDLGICGIDNICERRDSMIDGIRLTFKKPRLEEAMLFARQIKEKGYELCLQPVSITDYTDDEYIHMIERVNTLSPYAVSIVDTYGLMYQKEVFRYFKLLDKYLIPSVKIGYHPHNSFQIAYANAMEIMQFETERDIIIDATVNGMGKDSGNACTELIAYFLNENMGAHYEISYLLDIIDTELNPIKQRLTWGYSFVGFISASNRCRTEYTKYLLDKKQLSMKAVNEILSRIDPDKRTTAFHKEHIEQLYREYQRVDVNDEAAVLRLRDELSGKKLLLVAPGSSISEHSDEINAYIKQNNPTIIAANHVPGAIDANYIFISNNLRYGRMLHILRRRKKGVSVIITSNIMPEENVSDYEISYRRLTENEATEGNSMLLLLTLLANIGVTHAAAAGFDGFSEDETQNYFDSYLRFDTDTHTGDENKMIAQTVKTIGVKLDFVTPSMYEDYLK